MSREVGNEAETKATSFLRDNSYEILTRNYSTRVGEIDIIASRDGFICFVEVKYRNPMGYGTAIDAITKSKMHKILMTAKRYLNEVGTPDADYRIDVVVIDGTQIEILQNVYTAGM